MLPWVAATELAFLSTLEVGGGNWVLGSMNIIIQPTYMYILPNSHFPPPQLCAVNDPGAVFSSGLLVEHRAVWVTCVMFFFPPLCIVGKGSVMTCSSFIYKRDVVRNGVKSCVSGIQEKVYILVKL